MSMSSARAACMLAPSTKADTRTRRASERALAMGTSVADGVETDDRGAHRDALVQRHRGAGAVVRGARDDLPLGVGAQRARGSAASGQQARVRERRAGEAGCVDGI